MEGKLTVGRSGTLNEKIAWLCQLSCKIRLMDKLLHGYRAEFAGLQAWRRLLQINRQNLKLVGRMMLILLLVGVAEILVVLFVPKPLLWVSLIPVLIPLLTSFLIIFPMAKAEKNRDPRGRS